MVKKIYPSILDIKNINIDEWYNNFNWPLEGAYHVTLYHTLRKHYHAMIDSYYKVDSYYKADITKNILIVEFKIIYVLFEILMALKIKQTCDKDNISIFYTKGISFFDMVLNDKYTTIRTFDHPLWDKPFKLYSLMFKSLMKTESICSLISGSWLANIGKIDFIKKDYLKNEATNYIDFTYIFYKAISNKIKLIKPDLDMAEPCNGIINIFCLVAGIFNINIPEKIITNITPIIKTRLINSLKMYIAVTYFLETNKYLMKKDYLMAGLGNPWHRAIALGVRRFGCSVINVAHGNLPGMIKQSRLCDVELSLADKFLVETQATKSNFEKLTEVYKPVGGNVPQIISLEMDKYSKIWDKDKIISSKIKKVMFIEHGTLWGHDYDTPFNSQPVLMDLAVRILKSLYGKYHIILSAHPDALENSNSGEIYKPYVDEIQCGRFENNYNSADAFIFGYFPSSCFGFALATNKRMIYFDYGLQFVDEEYLSDLNRRCYCIKTWSDDRNRILFNESNLLEALS